METRYANSTAYQAKLRETVEKPGTGRYSTSKVSMGLKSSVVIIKGDLS